MSDLGGGGAQRRFLVLAQAFAEAGHRTDIVVASAAGDFRDRVPAATRLFALDGSETSFLRRRGLRVAAAAGRSEEHTSELQSLMRSSYAVFCLHHKRQPHMPS